MEKKSANEILREKYEERGWFELDDFLNKEKREIEKLPMTEEEYKEFSRFLAREALQESDEQLCELYFEIQRRAVYANAYGPVEGLEEEEMAMWAMGTDEKLESQGRSLH